MRYSNNIFEDFKYQFKYGDVVTRLIFINVFVFILQNLVRLGFWASGHIVMFDDIIEPKFMMAADPKEMLFQPWAVITHMFMHGGFFHILFNMLWFYWFSRIFASYLGEKRIFSLYIIGGLCGALAYILSYNFLPPLTPVNSYALGASAAVTAVVLATATYFPNHVIRLFIIGDIQIKWIALFYVVMDVVAVTNMDNTGGHIAHLGGAVYGVAFALLLQNGRDLSHPFDRLIDNIVVFWERFKNLFKPRRQRRFRVVHKSKVTTGAKSENARNQDNYKSPHDFDQQERVDEILDKISRSGYDSLTKEEKDFLFRVSKED